MLIYFLAWKLLDVWRVVWAEFVVYIFTDLGIHVSTDDENHVFRDTMN